MFDHPWQPFPIEEVDNEWCTRRSCEKCSTSVEVQSASNHDEEKHKQAPDQCRVLYLREHDDTSYPLRC